MKWLPAMLGVAAFALTGVAYAEPPLVIRFAHVVAPDTPKGRAAEKFKQLAEQRTGGRVRVDVYPNSRLYKDVEEFEALQRGWVELLAPSLSKLSLLGVPEFDLFDLPYLFPDRDAVFRVMDGEVGKELFRRLEVKGIVGLAYWDNGFKQMSARQALHLPSHFKGLKMRVQPGSRVLQAQMRILGATPRPLAFSEVTDALTTGVVDGTENPVSNFYTQGMHRVQKHLTISDHGYLGYAVIANKRFWDGLPADVRGALEEALRESTRYERAIAQRDNDHALAAVISTGKTEVYVLPPDLRRVWRQALEPVHAEFEKRIGAELMQAVRRAVEQPTQVQGQR